MRQKRHVTFSKKKSAKECLKCVAHLIKAVCTEGAYET